MVGSLTPESEWGGFIVQGLEKLPLGPQTLPKPAENLKVLSIRILSPAPNRHT